MNKPFVCFFYRKCFDLVMFYQNVFTGSSSETASLWWCKQDLSSHLVYLNPTFGSNTHMSSNQQAMHRNKSPPFSNPLHSNVHHNTKKDLSLLLFQCNFVIKSYHLTTTEKYENWSNLCEICVYVLSKICLFFFSFLI